MCALNNLECCLPGSLNFVLIKTQLFCFLCPSPFWKKKIMRWAGMLQVLLYSGVLRNAKGIIYSTVTHTIALLSTEPIQRCCDEVMKCKACTARGQYFILFSGTAR